MQVPLKAAQGTTRTLSVTVKYFPHQNKNKHVCRPFFVKFYSLDDSSIPTLTYPKTVLLTIKNSVHSTHFRTTHKIGGELLRTLGLLGWLLGL